MWPFGTDDGRRRRRMGQVARIPWQERWRAFFRARRDRRREPPPPKAKEPRAPKITAYDEDRPQRSSGRSLPRWQREVRAAFWKRTAPLRRLHARVPAAILVLLYLGLLGGVSALVIFRVLAPPARAVTVPAAEPSSSPDPAVRPFTLTGPAGRAPFERSLIAGTDLRELNGQMADIEFRAGNYAAAENLYRRLFLSSADRPFIGFRITVCSLLRDRHGQANDLLERLSRVGRHSPAKLYGEAVLALQEGREADAVALLGAARSEYGDLCARYDETLRIIGYEQFAPAPSAR